MGEIAKWLLDDDQKELFDLLFAVALNALFLALIALPLWMLGRLSMALHLAEGYAVLWIVIYVSFALLKLIQRSFRVNLYDRADAFVISNLIVSCAVQAGWSAFAASAVHEFVAGVSVWVLAISYLVGLVSCLVAFCAVSSCYRGEIYRLISLPLALVVFILCGIWNTFGRA